MTLIQNCLPKRKRKPENNIFNNFKTFVDEFVKIPETKI